MKIQQKCKKMGEGAFQESIHGKPKRETLVKSMFFCFGNRQK